MPQENSNTYTTYSQARSSSDAGRVRTTLTEFLEGSLSLPRLEQELAGRVVIDFDPRQGRREIRRSNLGDVTEITVENRHLAEMLERYLSGHIGEEELSDWAAFVFMADVFVPAGETEEERWQAGEGPLWDILQRLMTPVIFDGLDKDVVQRYRDMLDGTDMN